jgi:hypothetical protein
LVFGKYIHFPIRIHPNTFYTIFNSTNTNVNFVYQH